MTARRASDTEFDYLVKIVIVGESGVGKSSLLKRFADDEFMPSYISTIGVDFAIRSVDIDDRKVKMQLWDTAGQERFHNITTSYYRGAHGILLCIDVTDGDSVRSIPKWLREIEAHAAEGVPVLLVANKCDAASPITPGGATAIARPRVIDTSSLASLSKEYGIGVVETSARDRTNVDEAFTAVARKAIEHAVEKVTPPLPPGVDRKKRLGESDGLDLSSSTPATFRCCVIL